MDGEKWRHQRKVASSEFSNKVIRDYSSEILKTNAVKLARIISEAVNHDEAIEIQVSLELISNMRKKFT